MKHRIKQILTRSATALVLIACCSPSHKAYAASAEVITNGGFETGDFTGWSQPSLNPNPWSVVSGNSFTGTYSAYNPSLATAIAAPTLYQSFNPTAITSITSASLWYYDQGNAGTVGLATLLMFSDGTSVQDTLLVNDPSYKENVWAFRDLLPTLIAYPGKELVQIGFFPKAGGSQLIDDISIFGVFRVPEPTPFNVCIIGLICFTLHSVRRIYEQGLCRRL